MLEDMQLRNFSPNTREAYLRAVAQFALHYKKSPDQLGTDEVRAYLLHLVNDRHVAPSTFNQVRCALRFFYRITLGRDWAWTASSARRRSRSYPSSSVATRSAACSPRPAGSNPGPSS
jgi:hypothetical protein